MNTIDTDTPDEVFEAELIQRAMRPLNLALPGILAEADRRVIPAMNAMYGDKWKVYRTQYAEYPLGAVHQGIEQGMIPEFTLLHRRDRVHLIHQQTSLTIRFVKNFAYTGGLAPAGTNTARRQAYLQGTLRTREQMRELQLEETIYSLGDDTIFLLWTKLLDGTFRLQAVKPLETGRFPKSPKASLTFELGLEQGDYDALSFMGSGLKDQIMVPRTNLIVEQEKSEHVSEHGSAGS